MARERGNIRQYKRPINFNLGIIVFGCIFIYIMICVYLYFTSKHIVGYEVKTGSLSVNNVYKGIALREEEVFKSADSGFIQYYARESGRVAVGDLVYTVDETGQFSDLAGENTSESSLSDTDLTELKTEILGFTNTFSEKQFHETYDFKNNVRGTVLKLANYKILENIDSMKGTGSEGLLKSIRASKSGIVVYSVDGYEQKEAADLKAEDFTGDSYEKKPLIGNELVERGDDAFKLCLNENWSIVIPVAEDRIEDFSEGDYIKVKFLKNQDVSWAQIHLLNNEDGHYVQLSFNNSMITFCTDRFIDIELSADEKTGLKIPNSSIVQRDFFLVPKEYITKGGNSGKQGILKEAFTEEGERSIEFIETTIYSETDTDYYLDDTYLSIGDYIMKPDSEDKYAISKRDSLIGVYNINKGYADFKQIQILYQNDEYAIVKPNTVYGLSVYDYVVLDASSVSENDFIYE
ncbi:MAG: hypothetical protein E7300_06025 [Lachnospiraceae bacterium]|nr:hypothetical protein [Lachnospiraceae bacterium]